MKTKSTTQSENSAAPSTPALDENRLAWLALALSPGLGPKRILDAVKQLDTASQIFTLPLTDLEGLRFPAQAAQYIFDGKARRAAEEEWARVAAQGATLVSYSCLAYPERLREIYDPPAVLWVRGEIKLLSRPAIALRLGRGRDAGARFGGAAAAGLKRHGARH
jgi:DNA processing protein